MNFGTLFFWFLPSSRFLHRESACIWDYDSIVAYWQYCFLCGSPTCSVPAGYNLSRWFGSAVQVRPVNPAGRLVGSAMRCATVFTVHLVFVQRCLDLQRLPLSPLRLSGHYFQITAAAAGPRAVAAVRPHLKRRLLFPIWWCENNRMAKFVRFLCRGRYPGWRVGCVNFRNSFGKKKVCNRAFDFDGWTLS